MTKEESYLGSPMAMHPYYNPDPERGTQEFWRNTLLQTLMSPDPNVPTGPGIQRTQGDTIIPRADVPGTQDPSILQGQEWNRVKYDPDVLSAAIQKVRAENALMQTA